MKCREASVGPWQWGDSDAAIDCGLLVLYRGSCSEPAGLPSTLLRLASTSKSINVRVTLFILSCSPMLTKLRWNMKTIPLLLDVCLGNTGWLYLLTSDPSKSRAGCFCVHNFWLHSPSRVRLFWCGAEVACSWRTATFIPWGNPRLPCPGAACPAARGCCRHLPEAVLQPGARVTRFQHHDLHLLFVGTFLIYQITFEHFLMLYSCMCVQILGNLEVNKITGCCKSKCFARVPRCGWCVEGQRAPVFQGQHSRQAVLCHCICDIFYYFLLYNKNW